jgi:hypothetical protein
MLLCAEIQVSGHITMQQRAGGDHLGVEQGTAREQTVEETAVAIGPVHHRRHGQAPGTSGQR